MTNHQKWRLKNISKEFNNELKKYRHINFINSGSYISVGDTDKVIFQLNYNNYDYIINKFNNLKNKKVKALPTLEELPFNHWGNANYMEFVVVDDVIRGNDDNSPHFDNFYNVACAFSRADRLDNTECKIMSTINGGKNYKRVIIGSKVDNKSYIIEDSILDIFLDNYIHTINLNYKKVALNTVNDSYILLNVKEDIGCLYLKQLKERLDYISY